MLNLKWDVLAGIVMLFLGYSAQATETIALTRQNHGNEQIASSDASVASESDPDFNDGDSDDDEQANESASSYAHAEDYVDYGGGDTLYGSATNLTTAHTNVGPASSTFDVNIGAVTGGLCTGGATGDGGTGHTAANGHGISNATFDVGSPMDPCATMILSGTLSVSADAGFSFVQVGNSYLYCDGDGMRGYIENATGEPTYIDAPTSTGGEYAFSFVVESSQSVVAIAEVEYGIGFFFSTTHSEWPEVNAFADFSVNAN